MVKQKLEILPFELEPLNPEIFANESWATFLDNSLSRKTSFMSFSRKTIGTPFHRQASCISLIELDDRPPKQKPPSITTQNQLKTSDQINQSQYTYQLIFSTVNAIIFFPLFVLWIPGLLFSLRSRKQFLSIRPGLEISKSYHQIALNCSRQAKYFNIFCFISGDFNCVLFPV